MVIGAWQQIFLPIGHPLFSACGLALWAMPVATAIVAYSYITTSIVVALVYMAAKGGSAAFFYSTKCAQGVFACAVVL
jgi:hypothetical protein